MPTTAINGTSSRDTSAANGNGVHGGLSALEADLVQIFADLVGVFGLPRSYGEIYGLLFASPRPLSFTDLQAKLDLSKGSISQGLHALRDIGAIRPVDGSDRRREHFAPETELRQLIAGFLKGTVQPNLKNGGARIEAVRTRHKASLSARTEENRAVLSRLEKLQAWHRKAGTLLPVITKVLG